MATEEEQNAINILREMRDDEEFKNFLRQFQNEPAAIAGHNANTDGTMIAPNLNHILAIVIQRFGLTTLEDLDNNIIQVFNDIFNNTQDFYDQLGYEWRSDPDNVHDSSVNLSYVESYNKILEANQRDSSVYKLANVRSYYYQKSNELNVQMNQLMAYMSYCDQVIKYCTNIQNDEQLDTKLLNPKDRNDYIQLKNSLNEIMDKLTSYSKFLSTFVSEFVQLQSIIRVIYHIEKENDTFNILSSSEVDILLNIWKRIHSDINQEVQQDLLDILSLNLASLINKDSNTNEIECINGRVGAIICSLEVLDKENIVVINNIATLRVEMLQHRTPVLIQQFNEQFENQSEDNKQIISDYNHGKNSDNVTEYVKSLKKYLSENLKNEFESKLRERHFKYIIEEIMSAI